MPIALYLRVSTEEQRERQSIVTQREFGQRYCELHQLAIHEIYADDGISGAVPVEGRPAGIRLLEAARQKKFDQLLVFKLDRLGRETRMILNAVAELEKYGVRVKSMTEEFDTATATGRLMLTMLSGFAAHERELIRERSILGTNRIAETGAWLGGVVPYGYRKQGEKSQGRLVVSEDPIPGFQLSEADVVRMIYRMSATEKKSCQKIADHLHRTGIPCTSAWGSDSASEGKRNRRTAPIWRSSHVRNMIANRTYMGEHTFGKRTKNPNRKLIVRTVPAIVSPELWESAQQVLGSNRIMAKRNGRTPFLLRGLIKCGLCGLTFSGLRASARQPDHYYHCNGRQFARGLYGLSGKKCPAKSINGRYVEQVIWADIETFLRNPGEILEKLRERLAMRRDDEQQREKELQQLRDRWEKKAEERERMLSLFRRGRIDATTLDKHLDAIDTEAVELHHEIESMSRSLSAADQTAQLKSAEGLLAALRKRLDGRISAELKRRLVEALVESIRADTVECWGVAQSRITVTYRFARPGEAAPLVLPRAHDLGSKTRPPEKLETIGDHLRRRRLMLKLIQKQVAAQIGVDKTSIHNWETNVSRPGFKYMPAVIRFLGYNPVPPGDDWGERLVQCRTALGLSQKQCTSRLGVDPSTLARWERGERKPVGKFAERVIRLIHEVEDHCEMAQTA